MSLSKTWSNTMPLSTGQLVLARFVWKRDNHHFYVCRHYRALVVIGVVTHNMVASRLGQLHAVRIASLMAGSYTQVGTFTHTVKPVSTPENGFGGYPVAPPPYDSDALPPQIAALVRLRLLVPSSRGHGRLYIPCPPAKALTTSGGVSTQYRSDIVTTLTPLTSLVVVGSGGNLAQLASVVWKRPGNLATRITSVDVAERWSTQLRRGLTNTPTGFPFRSLS